MNSFDSNSPNLKHQIYAFEARRKKKRRLFILLGLGLVAIVTTAIFAGGLLKNSGSNNSGKFEVLKASEITENDLQQIANKSGKLWIVQYSGTNFQDTVSSAEELVELLGIRGIAIKPLNATEAEPVQTDNNTEGNIYVDIPDMEEDKQYIAENGFENANEADDQDEDVSNSVKEKTENKPSKPLTVPSEYAFQSSGKRIAKNSLRFSILNYDPDISYIIDYGNGYKKKVKQNSSYQYPKPGIFLVKLTASQNGEVLFNAKEVFTITKTATDPRPKDIPKIASETNTPEEVLKDQDDDQIAENTSMNDIINESIDNDINASSQENRRTVRTVETPVFNNPPPAKETEAVDTKSSSENKKSSEPSQEEIDDIFSKLSFPLEIAQKMPSFPGGNAGLASFLNDRIKYPQAARDHQIEGRVYMQFVVNEKGIIEDPKVLKGLGYGCDSEAMRLVSEMPNWRPGEHFGRKVPVLYTIPIDFKLIDR